MAGFNFEIKQQIWRRSGRLCERKLPDGRRCMAPAVDIHHITVKGMGGRKGDWSKLINDERNGMAVCRNCHREAARWNEDADALVPDVDYRLRLRRGY